MTLKLANGEKNEFQDIVTMNQRNDGFSLGLIASTSTACVQRLSSTASFKQQAQFVGNCRTLWLMPCFQRCVPVYPYLFP